MTVTPTVGTPHPTAMYEHITTVVAERQDMLHAVHKYLRQNHSIDGATYVITEPDDGDIPCQAIHLVYTGKIHFGKVDAAFHAAQAFKSGWRHS